MTELRARWFEEDENPNPRDAELTRAYIDGRNAARDGHPMDIPLELTADSLAAVNWETGYIDYQAECVEGVPV